MGAVKQDDLPRSPNAHAAVFRISELVVCAAARYHLGQSSIERNLFLEKSPLMRSSPSSVAETRRRCRVHERQNGYYSRGQNKF